MKKNSIYFWETELEAHINSPDEVTWSGMSCFPSLPIVLFNVLFLHINFLSHIVQLGLYLYVVNYNLLVEK